MHNESQCCIYIKFIFLSKRNFSLSGGDVLAQLDAEASLQAWDIPVRQSGTERADKLAGSLKLMRTNLELFEGRKNLSERSTITNGTIMTTIN
jgi:hypothetical protein